MATALHRGDYADLGRAHDAALRLAAELGRAPAGPRWEIYGHWHDDGRAPETEVFHLLVA